MNKGTYLPNEIHYPIVNDKKNLEKLKFNNKEWEINATQFIIHGNYLFFLNNNYLYTV